jgi:hypothetical protein
MKNISIILLIILSSASCVSVKVSSDYDQTVDFASYKTYGYIVYPENLPYERSQSERVLISIGNELNARGYKKSDNPDVFIDLKVRTGDKKTVASSSTGQYSTMYGQDYLYAWGTSFTTANINYDTYAKGTMFIDIIDARKKQLVWQGRGMANISPDRNSQEREKNIAEVVAKIMKGYPPKM